MVSRSIGSKVSIRVFVILFGMAVSKAMVNVPLLIKSTNQSALRDLVLSLCFSTNGAIYLFDNWVK